MWKRCLKKRKKKEDTRIQFKSSVREEKGCRGLGVRNCAVFIRTQIHRRNCDIGVVESQGEFLPNLSRMARDILCIMPSLVPVERFLSNVGRIQRPDRCSLRPETLKKLSCVELWSKSSFLRESIIEIKF